MPYKGIWNITCVAVFKFWDWVEFADHWLQDNRACSGQLDIAGARLKRLPCQPVQSALCLPLLYTTALLYHILYIYQYTYIIYNPVHCALCLPSVLKRSLACQLGCSRGCYCFTFQPFRSAPSLPWVHCVLNLQSTLHRVPCSESTALWVTSVYLQVISHHTWYLSFFFTRAKFLENKIYIEKHQFFALNL